MALSPPRTVSWMVTPAEVSPVLSFPSVSAWLWADDRPLMIAAAVFWLSVWVVLAVRLWWKWRGLSRRERRTAGLFLALLPLPLVVGGTMIGRDVRALQSWPFDPEAVESVVVEVHIDYRLVGTYHFAGSREMAGGLRLLEQSGECFSSKSQTPAGWTHIRYHVLVQLRGEQGPSRYVDAYPRTQRGVPAVEPGLVGSNAGSGLYSSEPFVRWLESLIGQAGEAKPGARAGAIEIASTMEN